MRSPPHGSASTRSRKPPDLHGPSQRSRKENPGARGTPGHPARQPGRCHTPALESGPRTRAASRSAPAINPDERSGLGPVFRRTVESFVLLRTGARYAACPTPSSRHCGLAVLPLSRKGLRPGSYAHPLLSRFLQPPTPASPTSTPPPSLIPPSSTRLAPL